MNKKLILWISASVITFLFAFLHQRLNPNYPVSGSFGIEGEKVTYAFDKIHRGKDPVEIRIRTDINGIKGKVSWRKIKDKEWKETVLFDEGNFLTAVIPPSEAGDAIQYRAVLEYNSRTYYAPSSGKVTLFFSGKRPSSVMNVFYLFLFGGLLLSVRGALEYFNPEDKRILFASLTAVFLFIAAVIFYPFIRSYELGAINRKIPEISTLFDLSLMIMFLISFVTAILMLKFKNKILLLIAGIVILIIYQFSSFY